MQKPVEGFRHIGVDVVVFFIDTPIRVYLANQLETVIEFRHLTHGHLRPRYTTIRYPYRYPVAAQNLSAQS
jgi:hypothetical protein